MRRKAQAQVGVREHYLVLPLLAIALIANAFLFSITYTNASFSGVERQFPQVFSPAQISQSFDRDLSIIAENMKWSVSATIAQAKDPLLNLLGLQDYKFGMPRYTAIASQANGSLSLLNLAQPAGTVYAQAEPQIGAPQVLGAFTVNYDFIVK